MLENYNDLNSDFYHRLIKNLFNKIEELSFVEGEFHSEFWQT